MSDEPRFTRRAFVGDVLFLGTALVASVAWGWSQVASTTPAPSPQTPDLAATPTPAPSSPATAPSQTPGPDRPPKPRPGEFDDVPLSGKVQHIPSTTAPSPSPRKPRPGEFDREQSKGELQL